MSAVTETRWPLELRAMDSATVAAGSVTSIEEPNGNLSLTVALPAGNRAVEVNDRAPNEAMAELRRQVEDQGWLLCCNRFHRDASTSGMASGLSCYVGPRWRPLSTSTDLRSSLAPASPADVIDAATAKRVEHQALALPKRLVASVLIDTSFGRRVWARLQERNEQRHLELYGEGDDWFEPVGQVVAADVGMVYRARYRNSLSVFFAVVAVEGGTIALRQFAFAVDDPSYVPATLFTEDHLVDRGFRLAADGWTGGPFSATGTRMDPVPGVGSSDADQISLEALGPAASEAIDIYPSLRRTA